MKEDEAISTAKQVLPVFLKDDEYVNNKCEKLYTYKHWDLARGNMTKSAFEKRCIQHLKGIGFKFYNDVFTNSKDESHHLLVKLRNKLQSVDDLQRLQKLIENF